MEKILYIFNIAEGINSFFYSSILAAKAVGLEFHLAGSFLQTPQEKLDEEANKYGVYIHRIDLSRSPYSLRNIKAYREVVDLIKKENINYIHCNTPVGGLLGRFAGMTASVKSVIYQAHGFHFYKGAPLINWMLYCPVEMILARITDVIITINKEDYQFALKHMHPRSKVYYVPGVGIELGQWRESCNAGIRSKMGLSDDDFFIVVVGRLEENKNCKTIIDAISKIVENRIKVVFCGDGKDREKLQKRAKTLNIDDRVLFIGNRTDMVEIYHMADCFVLASFREGLSRSIMEAMACGLPCIVSDIRGNGDLIDEQGGFLFDPNNEEELRDKIVELYKSKELYQQMKMHNLEKIKQFSLNRVVDDLVKIYKEVYE